MDSNKVAVLLLAHGTPDSVNEIPEYLRLVMRGRPASPKVIEEVTRRYQLIGRSPLTAITLEQAALLSREIGMPVYVGMRNWKPFIADTVRTMRDAAVERAIVICLAPQNSRTSVGLYRAALSGQGGVPFAADFVESWHDHPLLIRAFAEKLRVGWQHACNEMGVRIPVILTAHSVPQRTIMEGDPYEGQARETAALVAREARLSPEDWRFAFQSQGMTGEAWLGPTVEETIVELQNKGHRCVFVQAIGFLCDHVEVLYDIDIGFRQFAEQRGMLLRRAESLNDSPLLTAALADIVQSRLSYSEPRTL
jgi:protoporphyrin/coproporphyrin ferrochelatase